VQDAIVVAFGAPVDGLGSTGRFKLQMQDRAAEDAPHTAAIARSGIATRRRHAIILWDVVNGV